MSLHAFGFAGQHVAEQFLKKQGYQIIGRNFRTRFGEIDIVAKRGDIFVFVEVKTRSSTRYGTPEEAVNRAKQRHLVNAGRIYLSKFGHVDVQWQIDVVGLLAKPYGGWEIRHIPNAVGW